MLICLLPGAGWVWAQDEEILRAARYLSGASSEEQVDEYWIERLEARNGRRIRINEKTVRADGLLSDYQLASLADYKARCGDVLSWEELALVDGFSREAVEALRPFLSLASSRLPGSTGVPVAPGGVQTALFMPKEAGGATVCYWVITIYAWARDWRTGAVSL